MARNSFSEPVANCDADKEYAASCVIFLMRCHSAIDDMNVSALAGLVCKCVIKTHHRVNNSYEQWWVNMIELGKEGMGNNTESEPRPDFFLIK